MDVEALKINESDLNTKRMLDLMAVNKEDGPVPLYLHTIFRILREMRIQQQESGRSFNYVEFKNHVDAATLNPAQLVPLRQRLDTLESFMPKSQTSGLGIGTGVGKKKTKQGISGSNLGNSWASKVS